MLYYSFNGYEGFKELFGLRECGNGQKTRRNKILLSYIKQNDLLKKAIEFGGEFLEQINIRSMTDLLLKIKDDLYDSGRDHLSIWSRHGINLHGWTMFSDKYRLDEFDGVCEDRDYKSIRYVNLENGRVFKMKAGKFLKTVMEETDWGKNLPEPVKLWVCEEFTQEWETHTRSMLPEYTLHVNHEFSKIYDSDYLVGDFHSCMVNEGNESFYEDYVNARAAYLTRNDDDDSIIARCVIFDEVHLMRSGKVLRLAERQYTTDCEDVLKRCLVDALIKAGEIDGYKKVGADCHSGHAFVYNDGSSLDEDMWIECSADDGDTCSYMDSFKYLNIGEGRAYNDSCYDHDAELDTTDGYVEARGRNYDSWNEVYTNNDVVDVYSGGRHYTCDEYELDDFVYVECEDEYHHVDDVSICPLCGDAFLMENGYYSELTGEDYDCEDCLHDAERDWLENYTVGGLTMTRSTSRRKM